MAVYPVQRQRFPLIAAAISSRDGREFVSRSAFALVATCAARASGIVAATTLPSASKRTAASICVEISVSSASAA